MSFYTSGVKSNILEPVVDITNNRTEWRIPSDTVYLSNIRICNLALTGTETAYNRLVGAYGVIKSISLMDGNETLDQLLVANVWIGFKQFNKTNSSSLNAERRLALNAVGYKYDNGGAVSDQIILPSAIADEEATTAKSYLSLKDVFPFLRSVDYVSTVYFKNLRIVIEYETNTVNLVTDVSGADYETCDDPLLVMDEVVNDKVRRANATFKGVTFLAMESDSAYIPLPSTLPASTVPVTQTENVLIKGFDNKYVSRMLICFTPRTEAVLVSNGAVFASGYVGSYASIDSKLQLRINGVNKLAGEGITRPNQRLAMLNDTWGNCNAVVGGNDIGVFIADYLIYGGADADSIRALQKQYTGTADYHGILIADRIQDLQIAFTRTLQYDEAGASDKNTTQFNDSLKMTVFAEVQKSIVPRKGGGYDIRYA